MESFGEEGGFKYDPESENDDGGFSGILEIHVHHARNIHNICIYDKQDVYAKFSLTYNPDDATSTRIVNGGGRNPDFNDHLIMNVTQPDAVLKCEIWMLSRAKNFMDDQLLGFVLLPLSSISAKGTLSQDFHLSSTDLFHSPAGIIKLSLFLNAKPPSNPTPPAFPHSSATSDINISHHYCRIEFPDIHVVDQNHQMVSEYGAPLRPWPEKPDGSFLHLGAAPSPQLPVEDYEMAAVSPDASSIHNSTMTSLSDDRNSVDSMEENERSLSGKDGDIVVARQVKMEAEESAMQQQIVDMYMRSMQQFTESLAKMKLPMDLDKKMESENNSKKTKDSCRVFYGSRAFF